MEGERDYNFASISSNFNPHFLFPSVTTLISYQAAKVRKASRIFAIDVNGQKFEHALKLGATECINPTDLPTGTNIQSHIVTLTTYVQMYGFSSMSFYCYFLVIYCEAFWHVSFLNSCFFN